MKPLITTSAAAFFAGLLMIAGLAPLKAGDAQRDVLTAFFFPTLLSDQYLVGDSLIGARILGQDGKHVGNVDDLILSREHRVIGIVLGVGGALGFGEKRIGVRMSAVKISKKKGKLVLTLALPNAALKDAAAFKPQAAKKGGPEKSLIERAAEAAKKITADTADATKKALKKAARKTSETVVKAREATKKVVEPAKPLAPAAKPGGGGK